ncbi:MAG: hypothetical protein HY644_10965 [Acidobacteria bacterium]|nr:hypothetical protein [Acidobacteriota bacterium]
MPDLRQDQRRGALQAPYQGSAAREGPSKELRDKAHAAAVEAVPRSFVIG